MDLAYDSQIGQGAFAAVWLATDPLGRRVAVKFFNDTTMTQAEKNALDHAKALARVHHPAVVQVLSLEKQTHPDRQVEVLAIIMEYVAGPSLSLHRESISRQHAIAMAADLTAAIEAIHRAGMVHGDLHDGNVIVTASGAKLVDILYTHSLAEVGTRTAARTREDDLRELAVLIRQVFGKAGIQGKALEEAYFRATDAATTPGEVLAEFKGLSENESSATPKGNPAAGSPASLPGVPTAASAGVAPDPAPPSKGRILQIIRALQSRSGSVSECVADALALALELDDPNLQAFCRREMSGYWSSGGFVSTDKVPDSEHRLVQFYVSIGIEINLDFFGSGRNAIEWMEGHPNDFKPIKFLFPKPISQLEEEARTANDRALLSTQLPPEALVPGTQLRGTKIMCYARADALGQVLEGVRTVLTAKLLRHVTGNGR